MDRTERLLGLIAGLIDAREPVPWEEIRTWFPEDYGGASKEATQRKFERDKEDLLLLGVPVRWCPRSDDHDVEGYLVDRAAYELPPIDLTAAEAAVLWVAGGALAAQESFPYRRQLELGLQKIALRSEAARRAEPDAGTPIAVYHPVVAGAPDLGATLESIEDALERRKRITMRYEAEGTGQLTERTLDPYGLFCRKGRWSLVGHCHLRGAPRVFLAHRVREIRVNATRPGTPDFELPATFRLRDFMDVPPWRQSVHDPIRVEIEVGPGFTWLAERDLRMPAGPGGRFVVEATNAHALTDWVLGQGTRARIVAPPEIRDEVRAAAARILAAHGGTP